MLNMTKPAQHLMYMAQRAANKTSRPELSPADFFQALLDMPVGLHLRVLVDDLELDLAALRMETSNWESAPDLGQDWKNVILLTASAEAEAASKPYINTGHVLLALLSLWPEAPCSAAALRAAGGSVQDVRAIITAGS